MQEMNATSKTEGSETEIIKTLFSALSTDEKRALLLLMKKLVNKYKENEK